MKEYDKLPSTISEICVICKKNICLFEDARYIIVNDKPQAMVHSACVKEVK